MTPLAVISPETVVCAVGAQISNDIFVIQPAHHRDLVLQQHLKTWASDSGIHPSTSTCTYMQKEITHTRSFLVTSLVSNCFTAMSSPEFKLRPRNTVPKALGCMRMSE